MSLTLAICIVCERTVKSPLICPACQQSFHSNCLREYVVTRSLNDCCVKTLSSFVINTRSRSIKLTDSRSTSLTTSKSSLSNTKSQLVKSRSVSQTSSKPTNLSPLTIATTSNSNKQRGNLSSRNSSVASFKSATSSPRTPVTPLTLLSPNSDQVFVLQNSYLTSQSSSVSETSQVAPGLKMLQSTVTQTTVNLPEDWGKKNVDQKLTALMEVFLKSSDSMTHKIDNLGARLDALQNNVKLNSTDIAKLSEDLSIFKNKTAENTKLVNTELANMKKEVTSYFVSGEKPGSNVMTQTSSELVISGIPEIITSKLSPDEVIACVFNKLGVPTLTSDVLTTRKVEVKRKSSIGGSKKLNSSACSFVLK